MLKIKNTLMESFIPKNLSEFDLVVIKAANEIKEQNWSQAIKTLYAGLCSSPSPSNPLGLRLMARQFAEIKLALETKISVNEIVYWETFLFSKVSPNEWLNGSLGLAAVITNVTHSRIGDMVAIPCQDQVLKPFLVTSNYWCVLCNQQGCSMVCGNCKEVRYCSPEHQKSHWALHVLTCKQTKNPFFSNKDLYIQELSVLEELYKKKSHTGEK